MPELRVQARRATPQLMAELEKKGLLRRLRPSERAKAAREGDHVVERIELAAEDTGPWQMLAVTCHRIRLEFMTTHADAESWIFCDAPNVKPLLYVVSPLPEAEFERRVRANELTPDDILAIELRPNDPETSFFTVPGGVVHDEQTYRGPGRAPTFYVPEPSRMGYNKIVLDGYDVEIVPAQ
jgi:hypothetical protein